jgi:hypothetical protein
MVSATEGYLVGDDGAIAVWDGTGWSGHTSPTGKSLHAVTATSSGGGGGVGLAQWTEVIQ